jgi:hypothetical protein
VHHRAHVHGVLFRVDLRDVGPRGPDLVEAGPRHLARERLPVAQAARGIDDRLRVGGHGGEAARLGRPRGVDAPLVEGHDIAPRAQMLEESRGLADLVDDAAARAAVEVDDGVSVSAHSGVQGAARQGRSVRRDGR